MVIDINDLLPEFIDLHTSPVARKTELHDLIMDARHRYYNNIEPIPLDEDYDAWVDELASIEANDPAVTSIGATPVSEWAKVSHGIMMGSLNKVKTPEEMSKWLVDKKLSTNSLFVTEKLDGISLNCRYVNGIFTQAITRGDGLIGEDITANVARMKGVPAKLLDSSFTGSIRGEIILKKSDHLKFFPDKKNPRNAASGIAKRYDGVGVEHLMVMFYQVVDSTVPVGSTHEEVFGYLSGLGLTVPIYHVGKHPTEVWDAYQGELRDKLDYDIDGLVVRVNHLFDEEILGDRDGYPNGAVAYKFSAAKAKTVVRAILTPTGGTGRITPVAVVDPVQLGGATVTNASLYNWKYIRSLGVDLGATIEMIRSGDVIPRVVSVTSSTGTTFPTPTHCESCKTEVTVDGEYYVCPNVSDCPAQVVGRLKTWVSDLNVLDFGEVLLEKLVTAGLVKSIPDLYRLSEEQLASLDRMGNKSAVRARTNLWEKNPITLDKLLGALSIPLIGSSTIKLVMDAGFDTLPLMFKASYGELKSIKGLGPVKANELFNWLHNHKALLSELFRVGVKIKEKVVGSCTNKSFCFTGDIPGYSRDQLQQMVLDAGGEVKSSVNKKLTYLVLADPNSNTTKAQAARKNGTTCIGIEEFLKVTQG